MSAFYLCSEANCNKKYTTSPQPSAPSLNDDANDVDRISADDLRRMIECIVCKARKKDISLIPCGHGYCKICYETFRQTDTTCPDCRKPFTSFNPLFL